MQGPRDIAGPKTHRRRRRHAATTLSIPGVAVMERLVMRASRRWALPMPLGGCAVVLAITAYHEGLDGRDKPFLAAAALRLTFGAAALVVEATPRVALRRRRD